MSRSNPYKKKRRMAKKTILIYGEGLNEKIFLEYLRSVYSFNNDISVKIRNSKGGSPLSIVIDTINELGSFDKKIIVLDNDKNKREILEAENQAEKNNILIIKNYPCLEATFLLILQNKNYNKPSAWFKKEFEHKYMDKKKRSNILEYSKIFSKQLIDKSRKRIKELDILISLFEKYYE